MKIFKFLIALTTTFILNVPFSYSSEILISESIALIKSGKMSNLDIKSLESAVNSKSEYSTEAGLILIGVFYSKNSFDKVVEVGRIIESVNSNACSNKKELDSFNHIINDPFGFYCSRYGTSLFGMKNWEDASRVLSNAYKAGLTRGKTESMNLLIVEMISLSYLGTNDFSSARYFINTWFDLNNCNENKASKSCQVVIYNRACLESKAGDQEEAYNNLKDIVLEEILSEIHKDQDLKKFRESIWYERLLSVPPVSQDIIRRKTSNQARVTLL